MVMVGIDVQKDTHCTLAVDDVGRQLRAARTFRTTDAGNLQLLLWAQRGSVRALRRPLVRVVFKLLQPTHDTAAVPLPQAA